MEEVAETPVPGEGYKLADLIISQTATGKVVIAFKFEMSNFGGTSCQTLICDYANEASEEAAISFDWWILLASRSQCGVWIGAWYLIVGVYCLSLLFAIVEEEENRR